jgi:hypothetical protein
MIFIKKYAQSMETININIKNFISFFDIIQSKMRKGRNFGNPGIIYVREYFLQQQTYPEKEGGITMNQIWFQILAVMIVGSMLKYVVFSTLAWVIIDLAVLGISYLLLRRDPFTDMKRSMLFLGGLTVVNVLVDLGIIGGMLGNLILLGLLAYMMFGRDYNSRRRR